MLSLGLQKVSLLERCPYFGVSFLEGFHCITINNFIIIIANETTCLSNRFASSARIAREQRNITSVERFTSEFGGVDLLYVDIKFTCDVLITHVIAGAEKNMNNDGSTDNFKKNPEVRFWRKNDNQWTISNPTIQLYYDNSTEDLTEDSTTQHLRWYNLSSNPVLVKAGDILGIYQPTVDKAESILYYQNHNGPLNYYINNTTIVPTGYNHYPLVSVIYSES